MPLPHMSYAPPSLPPFPLTHTAPPPFLHKRLVHALPLHSILLRPGRHKVAAVLGLPHQSPHTRSTHSDAPHLLCAQCNGVARGCPRGAGCGLCGAPARMGGRPHIGTCRRGLPPPPTHTIPHTLRMLASATNSLKRLRTAVSGRAAPRPPPLGPHWVLTRYVTYPPARTAAPDSTASTYSALPCQAWAAGQAAKCTQPWPRHRTSTTAPGSPWQACSGIRQQRLPQPLHGPPPALPTHEPAADKRRRPRPPAHMWYLHTAAPGRPSPPGSFATG